jgi:multidrug efflux pump subunit AcrB
MSFNLSDWALNHRSFVWYLLIASLLAGAFSYVNLGREEDPTFAIKTMVVVAALPGATAEETAVQVTDRIERKLLELDNLKNTRSVTAPGVATVYVDLTDQTRGDAVTDTWRKVRTMMSDIRGDFPSEFAGFVYNDDFGDVYGNIYAFTSDGFTPRELEDRVDDIRRRVVGLDQAGKVDLIGTQDEVVYLEFSTRRLAALGLDRASVVNSLASQNAIVPSGVINSGEERILVRVTGQFDSATALSDINLRSGDTFFALSDVAEVRAGYVDPPSSIFRYAGQPAIGLIVNMRSGGNVIQLGEELNTLMAEVAEEIPIGINIYKVADQPAVVEESVGHFVKALVEAVVIVLAVSFISLGVRAGFVVALTIPLVLAMTFVILDVLGITLQRISLGALIISLGLLVDDAMIAIETMISRLEIGQTREKAASYAWTSIAFPMLSGTLVTVAGFIPIGLNSSSAGEYTFSLFVVIAVSLVLSWVVAVIFAPVLGVTFLSSKMEKHDHSAGRVRRMFHGALKAAMGFKWVTILITVALFGTSIFGMRFVEQQFFPNSDRTELIVDVTLRQNASIASTDKAVSQLEGFLAHNEDATFWSSYVGSASPRFVLTLDAPTPGPHMGQIIIQTPGIEARNRLQAALTEFGRSEIPAAEVFVKKMALGPPVGKPVQYRLSGPDPLALVSRARQLAGVVATDDRLADITLDWSEPSRVVQVNLDQDKLRQLGVTQTDIAQALYTIFDGVNITELRDDRYLIDIIGRGSAEDRNSLEALQNLQLGTAEGDAIPLETFATLSWTTEQPRINRRDGVPTVTVMAAVITDDQPDTIVNSLEAGIDAYRQDLPSGYELVLGGTVESSAESQAPIAAVAPIMLLVMVTLVMIQMQSFRLSLIVLAAAPLGLIGVVLALVPSGAPLGFVAILGVLALMGILIRNSIILVHEIENLVAAGYTRWNAVFEGSDSRARPILLTAAAASLALIPISRQVFWGPMALAMMGGIIVGTLITLLFIPALYCAVFKVKRPAKGSTP